MMGNGNEISVQTIGDFDEWYGDIVKTDKRAAAKINSAITQMRHGNLSSNVKSIGGGVFQRTIDYGPGYRVYFGKDGLRLIILLGGATKSQREQQTEIAASRERWQNYQRNRRSEGRG